MTISEIIKQGLHYARTSRSLWVFGFVVGIATGSSSGGGGGNQSGASIGAGGIAISGGLPGFPAWVTALVIGTIAVIAISSIVLRYISEGALIEGIVRARQGETMTTREGFRAGWAHFGVLLRIALVYIGATIGSLALVAIPCALMVRAFGIVAGLMVGVPGLIVAIPWLVTLYLIQAFASRIAVLENRRALDAIAKARLFLHGRLMHGLKLAVATFVGTLVMLVFGFAALVPVGLVLFALSFVLHIAIVIALCVVLLIPAIYVLTAIVGTFRSSVWTLGYVTQVEQ